MGKMIMHDIVVLKNLQGNITRIDCINKHFLGYSSMKQYLIWETPPIDSGILTISERAYLDALSSKVVRVRYQDESGNLFGQNSVMIPTIDTPHTLLTGPPGLMN